MIKPSVLPTWAEIFSRIGELQPRRGRAACPLCQATNRTTFSCHDEKGFHCFRCGEHGDKVRFIEKYLDTDFKGALRWFGIEPGKPPEPDPKTIRKRKIRAGLLRWAETLGRPLRFEFYIRGQVIQRALERLHRDLDDDWGWNWLAWALPGMDQLEEMLDQIDIGTEEQRLTAYQKWRKTT